MGAGQPELMKYFLEQNVLIVDTVKVVCGSLAECDYKNSKDYILYIDDTHIGPALAKKSSERLLEYLNCTPTSNGMYSSLAKPKTCVR